MSCQKDGDRLSLVLPDEVSWTKATRESVFSFFSDDRRRRDAFERFLSRGYWGVVAYAGGSWVDYGWVSGLGTLGPQYWPRNVQVGSNREAV